MRRPSDQSEESPESSRIMLGLLDAVEQDRAQSQRLLASELGIALGLVNAYLKRCIKKGLVKVRSAPARRYAYYLTPQGFAEKSRLTVEYLSYSFSFFRQAKTDCSELFKAASTRNVESVVLAGQSDLAEIAALCAMEHGVRIVGVVQKDAAKGQFIGLPVFDNFDAVSAGFDAVLITDLLSPRETCDAAVARFTVDRVLVPDLLRIRMRQKRGEGK
jgi:DNA-binding MarR family transcriptional regulator